MSLYKMNTDVKDSLKWCLRDKNIDIDKGIALFEELIYIDVCNNGFDREFGEYLNTVEADEWDVEKGLRLPEFYEKINSLLSDETIGWESMSQKQEDGYAVAYKYTECSKTGNLPEEYSMEEIYESVFYVYLDQCLKYESAIEKAFKEEGTELDIDYVQFAANIENGDREFYETKFVNLNWLDDENNIIQLKENECVKFIGEPGIGKTTQMKKLYWDEVKAVSNGERQILPIWIGLSKEIDSQSDKTLEQKIKDELKEYKDYYEMLLKNNRISLYLDGFNEVLYNNKSGRGLKKSIATYIDDLHKAYPELRICMTDRERVSICFQEKVTVCHFEGMTVTQMKDYADIILEEDAREKVYRYLETPESNWVASKTDVMIPEKMNALMELILDDKKPKSQDEFYESYIKLILERELVGKKDERVKNLKRLLKYLARAMDDAREEMEDIDIFPLWVPYCKMDEPGEMLELAIEMHILVQGTEDDTYRFKYPQYYKYFS